MICNSERDPASRSCFEGTLRLWAFKEYSDLLLRETTYLYSLKLRPPSRNNLDITLRYPEPFGEQLDKRLIGLPIYGGRRNLYLKRITFLADDLVL